VTSGALIVTLAASCSGAISGSDGASLTPARPDFTSGSRLRARVVRADGVSLFAGWHDRVHDVDCSFAEAADGAIRCVPSGSSVASAGPAYLDAACAAPAISAGSPDCPPPKLAVERDSCGRVTSIGRVATDLVTVDSVYYKHGDGSCTSGVGGGGRTSLTISERLPLTAFVSAKKVDVSRGGRLAQTYLEAEDGSAQAFELIDTDLETSCTAFRRTDRCVPQSAAWVFGAYSDPSCTNVLAGTIYPFTAACGTAPKLVIDDPGWGSPWDRKGCGPPGPTFFEVGARATGEIYSSAAAGCSQVSGDGLELFSVGPPTAPEALARLIHGSSGAGRIKLRAYADERGTRLVGYTLFDSARDEECDAALARDGAIRCLPNPQPFGAYSPYFSDSGCTVPTVATRPGCTAPPLVQIVEAGSCGADPTRRLYTVGAKLTAAEVYTKQGNACVTAPLPKDQDLYATTEIDPAAFALVQRTTE
jgi:hypothetical protein